MAAIATAIAAGEGEEAVEVQVEGFVDGEVPVGEGGVLEAFLDCEEGSGVGGVAGGICVGAGVFVGEHFGAVGVDGAGLAEGFCAAHCWWWGVRWLVCRAGMVVLVVGDCE